MPRIPIVEDLTKDPIPLGTNILVEYDPASQWYAAHSSIAATWLKTGGCLNYHISSQPPERVRSQLSLLGVNAMELESKSLPDGRRLLAINDWYTAAMGRIMGPTPLDKENVFNSLKVADLSIMWGEGEKELEQAFQSASDEPPTLRIFDNASCLARFNEEKFWIEFVFKRLLPRAQKWKGVTIIGFLKGVHSDQAYKTLEAAVDGIIDFKFEDVGDEARDLVRIRTMHNIDYDRRWHHLRIDNKLGASIES